MKSIPVYGLVTNPDHVGSLAAICSDDRGDENLALVTSFSEPPEGLTKDLVEDDSGGSFIRAARSVCEPLVHTALSPWPGTDAAAIDLMEAIPATFTDWVLRNFLWQAACGGFIYLIEEESLGSPDVVVHLTAAKILDQVSIAIMPTQLRTVLDTTQLTLTNAIVGEADYSTLCTLIKSLKMYA